MEYALAILDVGKTNKKTMIYDPDLRVIDSAYKTFESTEIDGIPVEPLDAIEAWFLDQLNAFGRSYPIRLISVTTHGATFVCVGEDGRPSLPAVDYTHEPGDSFHEEFYKLVGDKNDLQRRTATLPLGALINPAKGIYFAQQRYPDEFAKTRHILLYPQYYGYRLTGRVAADFTYAGCHTYLWDFNKMSWSAVADRLDIRELLPDDVRRPYELLGPITADVAERTGLHPSTKVTLGVHDSNASLLPYLIKKDEDFVLNSTGTWCVAMHPMQEVAFAEEEIGKSVFYNISPLENPVKTSILMGGLEFETYTAILKSIHGDRAFPSFDPQIYRQIIEEQRLFITPGVVRGSGQFPDATSGAYEDGEFYPLDKLQSGTHPRFFEDYPTAYAVLNLSLAIQTRVALERVGLTEGVALFTEGGFRNNPDYNHLMTAFFPDSLVALTNIDEATSFGAALIGKCALEGLEPGRLSGAFEIETKPVEPSSFSGIKEYEQKFYRLL
jgi:sugar (pentulose or hexulose) kinase